jgi:hypothetical protein
VIAALTMMRLASSLALLAAAATACSSNNNWDYLMLVIQWPATECMPQNFDCSNPGPFFTIHGEQLQLDRAPRLQFMPRRVLPPSWIPDLGLVS